MGDPKGSDRGHRTEDELQGEETEVSIKGHKKGTGRETEDEVQGEERRVHRRAQQGSGAGLSGPHGEQGACAKSCSGSHAKAPGKAATRKHSEVLTQKHLHPACSPRSLQVNRSISWTFLKLGNLLPPVFCFSRSCSPSAGFQELLPK